ncbi:MAG: nucleotidyltransferase domain-containing protein [Candidatus Melainabacteria bacterium]|nr:nucleotidyltransferase domain-containing protein [Candidatus Melainabacteria bacterium]
MGLYELVKSKRKEILKLAQKHGAFNVRVFGSVARQEANENSDIDFLVDFRPEVGLLGWSELWLDLEDLLGHKVDVATEKVLKERIKDHVLKEAKHL